MDYRYLGKTGLKVSEQPLPVYPRGMIAQFQRG
jgi:hypothetical protein